MKVSLFIEDYANITRRLFAVSRTILGFPFSLEKIFPPKLAKVKKDKAYDSRFNNMKLDEIKTIQSTSQDG